MVTHNCFQAFATAIEKLVEFLTYWRKEAVRLDHGLAKSKQKKSKSIHTPYTPQQYNALTLITMHSYTLQNTHTLTHTPTTHSLLIQHAETQKSALQTISKIPATCKTAPVSVSSTVKPASPVKPAAAPSSTTGELLL